MLSRSSLNALFKKRKTLKKKYVPPKDLVKYNNLCHGWADFNLVYMPNHPKKVMRLVTYFHKYSLPYHVVSDLDAFLELYQEIKDKTRIIWGDSELFSFIEKGQYIVLAVTFDSIDDRSLMLSDLEVEKWNDCKCNRIDQKFRSIYAFKPGFKPK